VVSNLQVLTAGTKYDIEQAKDGKPMPSTVVTLLVSPDDAERITLAQTEGSITLVLRNPLDVTPTETRGVRMAGLMGAPEPVVKPVQRPRKASAPVAEPPPRPAKQAYNVESIRAGKRTIEDIK
jgi:pilus assembly protein CpaB